MRIRQRLTRRKKLRGGLNSNDDDSAVGPILNINAQGPAKPPDSVQDNQPPADEDDVDAVVDDNVSAQDAQDAQEAKILYLENALNQCNAELSKIRYPDAPLELQVKTAGNVPIIKPRDLFAQLRDINLDYENPDTRLMFLAQLTKPDSSAASLPQLFYKFNVTPSENEPDFESATSSGTTARMPYPAVLLIRCVMGEDKHLEIKAVYVVAAETDANSVFLDTNTLQVTLNNLVKLETEDKYLKRTTPNANDAPIIGVYTNVVLTTRTMDSNSSNVDKLIEFIKNEQRTSDGNKSTYALRRFNIRADERVILNTFRDAFRSLKTSSGPQISAGSKATVGSAKTGLGGLFNTFMRYAISGGKRTKRTKIKYSRKKCKRKANANATKHNRFKGFKYMTSKRK
jgi:hypothetical protein